MLQGNGVLKPHPNAVREHELKRVDSNGLSGEERRCSRWTLAQSHMSDVAALAGLAEPLAQLGCS